MTALEIINTKEVLTKEEHDIVVKAYPDFEHEYLNKVQGGWLNINVYSEHDHDKRQFEMETS